MSQPPLRPKSSLDPMPGDHPGPLDKPLLNQKTFWSTLLGFALGVAAFAPEVLGEIAPLVSKDVRPWLKIATMVCIFLSSHFARAGGVEAAQKGAGIK